MRVISPDEMYKLAGIFNLEPDTEHMSDQELKDDYVKKARRLSALMAGMGSAPAGLLLGRTPGGAIAGGLGAGLAGAATGGILGHAMAKGQSDSYVKQVRAANAIRRMAAREDARNKWKGHR